MSTPLSSADRSDATGRGAGGSIGNSSAGEGGGVAGSPHAHGEARQPPVGSPIMDATRNSLEISAMLMGRSPWMSGSESVDQHRRGMVAFSPPAHEGSLRTSDSFLSADDIEEEEALLGRRRRGAQLSATGSGSTSTGDFDTHLDDAEEPSNIPAIDVDFSNMPRLSTFRQSTANCINLLLGIGLLSYPYVLRLAGWVPGISAIILMALVCNYTGKLIAELMEYKPDFKLREGPGAYSIVGFHDLGRVAFGTTGSLFVSAAFLGETFGYGCVYLIVEGDNLQKMLSGHELFREWDGHNFMILSLLIFLPTLWLRNLSLLSYFSLLGATSAGFLWISVIVSGFDGSEPNPAYCKNECTGSVLNPSPTSMAKWSDAGAVIGLSMVGLSGHAVFPTLRNDMEDRRLYPRVLDVSYSALITIYLSIAIIGYLMYGDACQEEITLNLGYSFASQLAVWVVVINPITKFALDMAPVCLGVEGLFFDYFKMPNEGGYLTTLISIVLRTSLACCALATVFAIPSFSVMMGIMGSICSFTMAVTFPCACYLKLKWRHITPVKKALNIILVLIGLFASISGAITAAMGGAVGEI